MRRILTLAGTELSLPARRISNDWNDGSDGFAWKTRNLQEKRALALEYLGDVKKRVPIHDAIRMRADLSRSSLQTAREDIDSFFSPSSEYSSTHGAAEFESNDDIAARLDAVVRDLLADEHTEDTLLHVSPADRSFLKDEFFGSDTELTKTMKEWLRLRRETAEYQSYMSIPEVERNSWSGWYLRNVRSDPESDQ